MKGRHVPCRVCSRTKLTRMTQGMLLNLNKVNRGYFWANYWKKKNIIPKVYHTINRITKQPCSRTWKSHFESVNIWAYSSWRIIEIETTTASSSYFFGERLTENLLVRDVMKEWRRRLSLQLLWKFYSSFRLWCCMPQSHFYLIFQEFKKVLNNFLR